MLGFTLSKMNLMIFAVAIFAIVYFFTSSLDDSLKVRELNDLVNSHAIVASEMISSPSFCDSLQRSLPERLDLGNFSSLYYVLKISAIKDSSNPDSGLTTVIFSAAQRNHPERTIAASSFTTTAKVTLLSSGGRSIDECDVGGENQSGNTYCVVTKPTDPDNLQIQLDPQDGLNRLRNRFFLIKQVDAGELKLYIVPCGVYAGSDRSCVDAKGEAGRLVYPSVNGSVEGFKC